MSERASYFDKLEDKGLITSAPRFIRNNIHYEVIMGSFAYGVTSDTSDMDVYGFCIPPRDMIFPHLRGEIQGFGRQKTNKFEQFQQHHILDKSSQKEYDITIYNIIKYFQLCMENNPNMIDSLFVPVRCITHSTQIGNLLRENRRLFLHKGSWHKFKGYAFSQLKKCKNKIAKEWVDFCLSEDVDYNFTKQQFIDEGNRRKEPREGYYFIEGIRILNILEQSGDRTTRLDSIAKFGYDVKFAYHIVRLLNEVEQILIEHDLDLERNREQLKAIRRGEWPLEKIEEYFNFKEKSLEELYTSSTLPHSPDEQRIKNILLQCLEIHYGSLDNCIKKDKSMEMLINDLEEVLNKYKEN